MEHVQTSGQHGPRVGWGGGVIKVANKLGKLQQYDHDLH